MSEPIYDGFEGVKRLVERQTDWQEREPTMRDRAEIEAIKAVALCRISDDLALIRRIYDQTTERHYS